MPKERLSMRHIREVLRLHYSVGMSQHSVARSLGLAQGTVRMPEPDAPGWPDLAFAAGLDDDVQLENRLYPPPSKLPSDDARSRIGR